MSIERKRKAKTTLVEIQQEIAATSGNTDGALSRVQELLDHVEKETIAPEDAVTLARELQQQYASR